MPGGDPAAQMVEVDLALLGCAHLVAFWQVIRLVQDCPRQKPGLESYSDSNGDFMLDQYLRLVASPAPAGMKLLPGWSPLVYISKLG